MAKAKPAQTPEVETPVVPEVVTQDTPEVTQPVITEVQKTSDQPTETTEAPAQVSEEAPQAAATDVGPGATEETPEAQTETAPVVTVAPEVSSLDTIAQDSVGDKYVREDGVKVTVLPGGTVREDY